MVEVFVCLFYEASPSHKSFSEDTAWIWGQASLGELLAF